VASIAVAAVGAFTITPMLLDKGYELALPYLDDLLANFHELFAASPTLEAYLPTLATGLITPIVFIATFAVCLLAVSIVRAILNLILNAILPKKKGILGRLTGLVAGAVGGALVALCFVFPITGYFTAIPNIYTNLHEIVSTEENPIDPTVEETIINLPNAPSVKFVNDLTKDYFDQFVSYDNGEETVSVMDDLTTITSVVSPALRFVKSVGDVETMDVQAVRDIVGIIGGNKQLRTIMAEVLSTASQKWLADEAFMGFNLKEMLDPEYKFALDVVLADLAVTTEATVVQDLNSLADTIVTLQRIYGYANMLQSGTATLAELEQKLTDVLTMLDGNTADLLHEFVSADVMESIGVANPELVTNLIVDVVSSVVDHGDHEQTAEDAAAINSIMHFAMGDASVTPEQVVDDIVNSGAIIDAINSAVNQTDFQPITVAEDTRDDIIEALADIEDEELKANLMTLFDLN
jgi:uncharacterized membrane protein required for colicin V production